MLDALSEQFYLKIDSLVFIYTPTSSGQGCINCYYVSRVHAWIITMHSYGSTLTKDQKEQTTHLENRKQTHVSTAWDISKKMMCLWKGAKQCWLPGRRTLIFNLLQSHTEWAVNLQHLQPPFCMFDDSRHCCLLWFHLSSTTWAVCRFGIIMAWQPVGWTTVQCTAREVVIQQAWKCRILKIDLLWILKCTCH